MVNTNNPMIQSPTEPYGIYMKQTRETLIDPDIYSRFVRNISSKFYASRFYKNYKSNIMDTGFCRDIMMYNIDSNVADIELHHNLPTLKQAIIMITEHELNTNGCVDTFTVLKKLIEAHRNNWMGITMLDTTKHKVHHDTPSDFISLKQCIGNPFEFIDHYLDGMTVDISYRFLMHFKLEDQYGDSHNPKMIKARNEILNWQQQQI